MVLVRLVENALAGLVDGLSVAGVTVSGVSSPDAGVVVFVVIPVEKLFAVNDCFFDGVENGRASRAGISTFESCFGMRVVVGHSWP
ncbi:MAG: hypothetical protein R2735_08830 [Microthrixaceae bacterium]